jgi:UDP-galactopyranose mutase
VPRPENRELYRKYALLAATQRSVTFVGRLAEYRYYNMDQVVASALASFEQLARTAVAS